MYHTLRPVSGLRHRSPQGAAACHASVQGLIAGLADGSIQVVDLTQPLSETTPVLVLPEPFANTPHLSRKRLSNFDEDGPAWAWDVLELGEHTGTHLDAPVHWITGRGGEDVASISPSRLVGPAVVIDKTAEVGRRPRLPADRGQPRRARGRARSDRRGLLGLPSNRMGSPRKRRGRVPQRRSRGTGHARPGRGGGAWLAGHPGVVGFGVETVGIDAGAAGGFDPGFPAHNLLLGAGRYGLTQLANLEALPVSGALVVVAPLKLVDGTGSPSRVLAFVPTSN